jgi:hypothetical protein
MEESYDVSSQDALRVASLLSLAWRAGILLLDRMLFGELCVGATGFSFFSRATSPPCQRALKGVCRARYVSQLFLAATRGGDARGDGTWFNSSFGLSRDAWFGAQN